MKIWKKYIKCLIKRYWELVILDTKSLYLLREKMRQIKSKESLKNNIRFENVIEYLIKVHLKNIIKPIMFKLNSYVLFKYERGANKILVGKYLILN